MGWLSYFLFIERGTRPLSGRSFLLLPLLLSSFALTACTGTIKVTLTCSEFCNPDKNGRPLPVMARVYQLSNKDNFERAKFLSLCSADERLLGKDVLWRREVTLLPLGEAVVKEDRKEGAEYIAVMACFREGDRVWRRIVAIRDLWIKSVSMRLDQRAITPD